MYTPMMTSSNGNIFRVTGHLCVRGIHRPPVNSPHKGQWREALMFSLISAWINGWANNRDPGDLRRYRAHYDVFVMPKYGVASATVSRAPRPSPTGISSCNSRWHIEAETKWLQFPDSILKCISWMKMYEFGLRCHWGLFLRAQLTIFQH